LDSCRELLSSRCLLVHMLFCACLLFGWVLFGTSLFCLICGICRCKRAGARFGARVGAAIDALCGIAFLVEREGPWSALGAVFWRCRELRSTLHRAIFFCSCGITFVLGRCQVGRRPARGERTLHMVRAAARARYARPRPQPDPSTPAPRPTYRTENSRSAPATPHPHQPATGTAHPPATGTARQQGSYL